MKRTILLLAVVVALVLSAKAQQQTATLQRGNSTTYYYGEDAFKEAYNAANDGSVITLSAGGFNRVDSIMKSIKIIGSGGFPIGTPTTYFGWWNYEKDGLEYVVDPIPNGWIISPNTIPMSMLINANNVSIEGVYFGFSVILRNISGLRLTRCYIDHLFCTNAHTNTIIDQCYIKEDCAETEGKSVNCCIKNSFVEGICVGNHKYVSSNSLTILNSLLYRAYYLDADVFGTIVYYSSSTTIRNSILGYFEYRSSTGYDTSVTCTGDFLNCLWFLYPYHYDGTGFNLVDYLKSYTAQIYDNDQCNTTAAYSTIFNENVPWYDPNYIKTTVLGDDGTVVGPYGGTGFSLYPSIPRITESKIDTYTDGEGKLNVKVKVEVGQ